MSEKEKEMEEREIVEHWSHEHPLALVETRRGDKCYGCEKWFSSGEEAYGCSEGCWYTKLLHQECAGVARKIRHELHPQHIFIQEHERCLWKCKICGEIIWSIGYRCKSIECKFQMHMRCAQYSGMMEATADDDDDEQQSAGNIIRHPSHPKHELKLLRRFCSFKCDACGTTRRGSSYTCTADACEYWIHERCASLSPTMEREDHHHSLTLSFHIPLECIKYDYKCDVCKQYLLPKHWIYHCHLCRYIVHIKCAYKSNTIENNASASNGKDMIQLPTNDVAGELITPFVKRQGGEAIAIAIPPTDDHDHDEMVNVKYKFLHHQHQLTLSFHYQNQEEEEDEEEEDYGKKSELLCDGCITPIFSSSDKYYYMSCSECKYNLHMACFHLPSKISSPAVHKRHPYLLLQSSSRNPWEYWKECWVCWNSTNGLFYACIECSFKADIKCASMPDTIYHMAHPQHPLNLLSHHDVERQHYQNYCGADCGVRSSNYDVYVCGSCDFIVHVRCAGLPTSISTRRWDKHHPLPLTYDAHLNHPDEFYCDECETEMNPKSWMYHCRQCDISFHPRCFITTSGEFRNIKFGKEYVINAAAHPPHPLAFQLLTTKRPCHICHRYRHTYKRSGFHCALCNFFICLYCGQKFLKDGNMKAVD
ncbi:uncharacterized protein LOC131004099 [Salvia miltiorrhiza]|uniref:uncharacterized protein LOC131004099 n=1 Tax=Salvia miltiorrhiza TaxID=226208 RepID=UPI0025AC0A4C|nr:uncharacterized protein LOC131004099 [Salvia miltiorrhiza]